MKKKHYIKECKKNFGDMGICFGYTIGMLIGFAEDKYDYYYILLTEKGKGYYSMVGGFSSLKSLKRKEYKYIERLFLLNNKEEIPAKFIKEVI